jgi:hypothetical protein
VGRLRRDRAGPAARSGPAPGGRTIGPGPVLAGGPRDTGTVAAFLTVFAIVCAVAGAGFLAGARLRRRDRYAEAAGFCVCLGLVAVALAVLGSGPL